MIGRVNSFQSLGTVDGPGIRFVVFFQGCNLRCSCCHNPDTWNLTDGKPFTPEEIVKKAERYREYFGEVGGITLSGGEPLVQSEFASEIFSLCKKKAINTCLDTSGSIINQSVDKLLDLTDYVLLDVKYTNDENYQKYVGCEFKKVLQFLEILEKKRIKTTIRQVIIPTINDTKENVLALKKIAKKYSCVQKIELLPFKKICQSKYDNLGIAFPFREINEPTESTMNTLNSYL